MSIKNILVADDHPIARQGLLTLIKHEWSEIDVIEASNGLEAIHQYAHHSPDVLLIDYRMPELSGYEVAEQLLKNNKEVKIILLTIYDSAVIALNFLKIGGKGFLHKGCATNEIIEAIRSVLIGDYYFHSNHEKEIIEQLEQQFSMTLPKIKFTARDLEIVLKISRGMTSKEIGESMQLSTRSVETYRYDLIRKTQVNNSMQLIDFIYRIGICKELSV
jgi:two-component system response regulator NreC